MEEDGEGSSSSRSSDTHTTLWQRIEVFLQPQEVFTIRTLIGEGLLSRNDDLWAELHALEDILQMAKQDNHEMQTKIGDWKKKNAGSAVNGVYSGEGGDGVRIIPWGPERNLLEGHIRILLEQLDNDHGGLSGAFGSKVSSLYISANDSSPQKGREGCMIGGMVGEGKEIGGGLRTPQPPPRAHSLSSAGLRRALQHSSGENRGSGNGGGSSRGGGGVYPSPCARPPPIPLETPREQATYDYIMAGGSDAMHHHYYREIEGRIDNRSHSSSSAGTSGGGGGGGGHHHASLSLSHRSSRPGTAGSRSSSSSGWSSRSAPEVMLEASSAAVNAVAAAFGVLAVAGEESLVTSSSDEAAAVIRWSKVEEVMGELRDAFDKEAQGLMAEIEELHELLEEEGDCKTVGQMELLQETATAALALSPLSRSMTSADNKDGPPERRCVDTNDLRAFSRKLEEELMKKEYRKETLRKLNLPHPHNGVNSRDAVRGGGGSGNLGCNSTGDSSRLTNGHTKSSKKCNGQGYNGHMGSGGANLTVGYGDGRLCTMNTAKGAVDVVVVVAGQKRGGERTSIVRGTATKEKQQWGRGSGREMRAEAKELQAEEEEEEGGLRLDTLECLPLSPTTASRGDEGLSNDLYEGGALSPPRAAATRALSLSPGQRSSPFVEVGGANASGGKIGGRRLRNEVQAIRDERFFLEDENDRFLT